MLFDPELVSANRRLLENPADLDAKVEFVTTYMMVIEGTLALTGQYCITDDFERQGVLPGFLEGFRKISQDEHRHVAHGTWFLQQQCRDPHSKEVATNKLLELIPIAGVLVPRGANPERYSIFGYSNEETNTFAFTALTRRLKVIGITLGAPATE